MKKIFGILVAITLILSFGGCKKKEKDVKKQTSDAINVTVMDASNQTIKDTVTYTGEIKASQSTSVSCRASGTATAVYKEVGDYVKQGEVLLRIDDKDYQLGYNQAKAAYDGAVASYNSVINGTAQKTKLQLESSLSSAKIEYNDSKTNYENQKILYDNGAISKTAYDAALKRYENAKINLDSAQNNYDLTTNVVLQENKENALSAVNSAKASLDSAKSKLSDTTLVSPVSGYIASKNAERGQMVAQGVEVFSIKSSNTIDAVINVTEAIIPSIKVGTNAKVKIKSVDEEIEAKVSMVSPTKDVKTGLYPVWVSIANNDQKLKDGMFADITLSLKESINALVVNSESILEDSEGVKYVYVVDGKTATRKNITTGIITDKYVEVLDGLSSGEKIVVSGKEYLSEKNNKIKIVD